MDEARQQKIRELNDKLRCRAEDGRIVITQGVQTLGLPAILNILKEVATFTAFSEDNDPYGEHDCATMTVEGVNLIWKIDYYDKTLQYGSPDPTDPKVTTRVLTILLSEEY